jgi:hypothetical protein
MYCGLHFQFRRAHYYSRITCIKTLTESNDGKSDELKNPRIIFQFKRELPTN